MKTNILVGITTIMLLLCNTILAATSDYTLGVFGNANGDDTINMQDVTYTELIILEYKDQTQLADADAVQEATGVPTIEIATSENLDFEWYRFTGYVLNE